MIARVWSARATADGAARYVEYFRTTVAPELQAIDGCEGARVLIRERDLQTEVVVMTWWTSLDAVRRFAGDELERAVVHETAAALLSDFDASVKHYTVAADIGANRSAGSAG